jgi:hypothetical protein
MGETKGERKTVKETLWWNEDEQKVLKVKKVIQEWMSVDVANDRAKEIEMKIYVESKNRSKKAVAVARAKVQDKLYRALDIDQFRVVVGLHWGSALSPYLFLLVMGALTSDRQERASWCRLYADDIVMAREDYHEGPE